MTCADDHSGTYERHLCDSFNANCTTLAISGIGLYENCPALHDLPTMATLWRRTIVGDPQSVWDDASFIPDGVLLALGTNDNANNNGSAAFAQGFTAAYAAFLVTLSDTFAAVNPRLAIFAAAGPITLEYAPFIASAIDIARAQGVRNVFPLNFSAPLDRCGHPPYDSHVLMAAQARPVIAAALWW